MTNSTKFAVALALVLAAIVAVASGDKYSSATSSAALPLSSRPGDETPVRATKGDRLQVRSGIRKIAGVTVVLRDFNQVVR
jgi:hypothetical protein